MVPPTAGRSVWRPRWYAWALVGLLMLAAVHERFPQRLHGHWLPLSVLGIAVVVLALRRLWDLPPVFPMCAAIGLTIFSNGWSLIGLGGLPLNRLFLAIVLLQFLLRAPGIAKVPRLQVRNVHLLMVATLLYAVASAAAAGTLTGSEGVFSLVDILGLAPFLAFFLAPAIFAGDRERDILLGTLVGVGLYLGVTSVFEALGPHALVLPSYIVRSDQISAGVVQASGPFQSPVAEGFAGFACAVAALIAFLRWRGRWQRRLCVLAGFTCMFACFASLERGVWIAAVVAIVLTAAATRAGRRLLIPAAVVSALALGGILAVSSQLSQETSQRANYQQSVWDRKNQTAAGIRMVEAKPLLGFGWNHYRASSEDYFRQPPGYPMTGRNAGVTIGQPPQVIPLHDTYLSYAVELGLIGWALWLVSLLVAVIASLVAPGPHALRPWKLGLLAVATFFFVVSFFDPHEQPFPMALVLLWAGVAYGPPTLRRRTTRGGTRSDLHRPRTQPVLT